MIIGIDRTNVLTIGRHFLKSHLRFRGFYWVLAIGLLFSLLSVNYLVRLVNLEYVSIIASPFNLPVIGFGIIMLIFLSIAVGSTVSREKELGILELLFGAPISIYEYLLGLSLGGISLLVFIEILYVVFLWIISLVTGFKFSLSIISILLFSLFSAFPFWGLGILVSSFIKSTKSFTLLLTMVFGVLIVLSVSDLVLATIITERNYTTLIVIRDILTNINSVLAWISPVEIYFQGIKAINSVSMITLIKLVPLSFVVYALLVYVSTKNFLKQGILP